MAYIANRPVRFDRSYAIGERIPDGVIDPKMTTKLIGMGRIIRIPDTETAQEAAPDGAGLTQDGDNSEGGTNTHADTENAAEGKSDGADGTSESDAEPEEREYRCAECGRTFTSANGLAAHSRTHKK